MSRITLSIINKDQNFQISEFYFKLENYIRALDTLHNRQGFVSFLHGGINLAERIVNAVATYGKAIY